MLLALFWDPECISDDHLAVLGMERRKTSSNELERDSNRKVIVHDKYTGVSVPVPAALNVVMFSSFTSTYLLTSLFVLFLLKEILLISNMWNT